MNGKISPKSKILVAIAVVAISSFVFVAILQDTEANKAVYDGPPKAAIIDQLHGEYPNEVFTKQVIEYFENSGYVVDVYTTEQVTVDLYKQLPQMNYDYVIVRTHGVTDTSNEKAMLFTGERYSDEKYISDQLLGNLERATPLLHLAFQSSGGSSDWQIINDTYRTLKTPIKVAETARDEYFAITPKFVKESMTGEFDGTIFLLGGCRTMSNPSLAESFLDKGASMVLGWEDNISSNSNDYALEKILRGVFVEDLELKESYEKLQESDVIFSAHFTYLS